MALTSAESLILLQDLAHSRTQSHADSVHSWKESTHSAPQASGLQRGEILKQVSLSLFTRAPAQPHSSAGVGSLTGGSGKGLGRGRGTGTHWQMTLSPQSGKVVMGP